MITYDEAKRKANLDKHGFDFVGCEAVFSGFTLTREDGRDRYGELRFQTLGVWNGVVVFVVHTPRGDDDQIISIRKAEKHEQRSYWQHAPH
ncbi:BrnT family toxin [Methylovulum psychrotolerans]|uniref:BrnT family toxin n=1 Tax=Methylovulum psychrotolerans TaxID=1704499 RepID=UPI001BFF005B|nr:BrnT family toxin [Methylovulum psychrotolerans]MBT9096518.1 BrnT family toxin [Methylovulum psychrotolerans]